MTNHSNTSTDGVGDEDEALEPYDADKARREAGDRFIALYAGKGNALAMGYSVGEVAS
jgi:hypothetical protein